MEKRIDVSIPERVKDFARIKKAVYNVPDKDNTEKIAALKQKIREGSYKIDYEDLADRMLRSEF